MHYDRIALGSIKVERTKHPSVECDALRSGERESLALAESVFLYGLTQLTVVLKRRYHLAGTCACSIYIRCIVVAPSVDEVLIVAREECRVPSLSIGETLSLAVLMIYVYLTVGWCKSGSLIIYVACLGIVAIHFGNIELATDGALQLTVHIIYVQIHESRAVAGQNDVVANELDGFNCRLLHILGHRLLDEKLGYGGARIDSIETELVLMTVHSVHYDAVGIDCRLDARHVSVGIDGHIKAIYLATLDVVTPRCNDAVVLTCLGILVRIESGIVGILRMFGTHTLVHLQRIGLYLRLVVANPAKHGAVGVEGEGAVESEFLLIHPIGNTVDDLIELAVLSHLYLGIVVEQLDKEDVAFANECHLLTVRRPCGHLLRSAVRQTLQFARGDGVDIVYGGV